MTAPTEMSGARSIFKVADSPGGDLSVENEADLKKYLTKSL